MLTESPLLTKATDGFIALLAGFTMAQQVSYFLGFTFNQAWLAGLALAAIGLLLLNAAHFACGTASTTPRLAYWPLWSSMLTGVVLVLFLHRPDADDEFYLGQAVIALDYADTPMAKIDVLKNGYVLTSYDFLRAAFSKAFHVPLLVSYYLAWPAVIAVFAVAFQWRLLNVLGIKNMAFAMMIFFVIMIGWGDVHRTPANMGFVRFFQGKAGLIWITIPSATLYWLKLVRASAARWHSLLLLFLSIVAGIGFSPTGSPLGILLISLFVLATIIKNVMNTTKTPVSGLLAILVYPFVIGLLMHDYFSHSSQGMHTENGIVGFATTLEMAKFVMGSGWRGMFAVLCLICVPLIVRKTTSVNQALSIYISICLVLLAFPFTSYVLGHYGYTTMSWRWLYVIPFTLAIMITVENVIKLARTVVAKLCIVVLFAILYLNLSPVLVFSEANEGTKITFPAEKWAPHDAILLRQYNKRAEIDHWVILSPASHSRY